MSLRTGALLALVALVGVGAQGRLPASDETAKSTLEKSPRHGEWINVLDRLLITRTYIVHPAQGGRSPLLLLISDDRGLSDWIRAVGDQLAQEGFTVVVPDLLSGAGPDGRDTDAFTSQEAIAQAMGRLTSDQVMSRLEGVWDYGMRLPGLTGGAGVVGFDWGGAYSVNFAAEPHDVGMVNAAVVFYGLPPSAAAMSKLSAPVLGLYAGNDARVTGTVAATTAAMKQAGKSFEPIIFEGAGHGFVRAQNESPANARATEQAWPRALAFLKQYVK